MSLRSHLSGGMVVWLKRAGRSALLPVQEGDMAGKTWGDDRPYHGPTLEDCQKAFWTIKDELMADAELRLLMSERVEPTTRPSLVVYTSGWSPEDGKEVPRIWGTAVLQDGYEAITYRQLYRLLIDAYSTMDGYLKGQLPLPLP
jgi:hypothetical protein